MTDPILAMPLKVAARVDQVFPTLTAAQIARIAAHGRTRRIQRGEVLLEVGDQLRFFVVIGGKIDIVSVSGSTEALIVALQPGQFTGEANMRPRGRRSDRSRARTTALSRANRQRTKRDFDARIYSPTR